MNFLERLFGIHLDGGSGSIETALLLLPLVAAVLASWRASIRKLFARR